MRMVNWLPTQNLYRIPGFCLGFYVFTVVVLSTSSTLNVFSRIAALMVLVTFAADLAVMRRRKLLFTNELKPLVAFFLLLVASGLWASNVTLWFSRTFTVFQLVIFAFVATNIISNSRNLIIYIVFYLLGILYAVYISIYNANFDIFSQNIYRYGSILVNSNAYGISLFFGILFALFIVVNSQNRFIKSIVILAIFIFAQQIVFVTGSRKAMISLVICLPVFLFFRRIVLGHSTPAQMLLALIALIILYFGAVRILEDTPYYYRFAQIQTDLSEGKRGALIKFGLQKWQEKPILGFGANQYRSLYAESEFRELYAHNNYVELLANNGLLGLILFYSFFPVTAVRAWHLVQAGRISKTNCAWIFMVMVILVVWDYGLVSYYDKSIWLMYIYIVSVLNVSRLDSLKFGYGPSKENFVELR